MRPVPGPNQVPKEEKVLGSKGDTKNFEKNLINRLMPFVLHVLYCSAVLQKFPTIYTFNQLFPTLSRYKSKEYQGHRKR